MSATNFYHTFYQAEQLFRLADDVWTLPDQQQTTPEPVPVIDRASLLDELDTLLTERTTPTADPVPVAGPIQAGPIQAGPIQVGPIQAGPLQAESILPEESVHADPIQTETIPAKPSLAGPIQAEPIQAGPIETPVRPRVETQVRPTLIIPEPLPQPAPRPSTPSVLPPRPQPSRLPQLNHKVLLLADEQLDPSNLLFLEKILRAVNLNIDGVDLLNLHGVQDMDFAELLRGKYIHHFITFGVPFERINLDIMMDRYSPVRFEGITFLMADSLPTIEADQNLKKRLWGALQRVFLQRYT